MSDDIKVELPEDITKKLAEVDRLSAELAAITQKLAGDDKAKDGDDTKLTTGLDSERKEYARIETELSKAREDLRKAIETRTAELTAAREEVAKLHQARRRESFIKRCEPLDSLPGTQADDFAETLDLVEAGLRKVAPERAEKLFAKFYERLVSWNTVVEKNNTLFKEIGVEGGDFGMLSGVEAQLEALTREKMAADPKLTHAIAYDKVLTERPELYRKYRAEQAKGA